MADVCTCVYVCVYAYGVNAGQYRVLGTLGDSYEKAGKGYEDFLCTVHEFIFIQDCC